MTSDLHRRRKEGGEGGMGRGQEVETDRKNAKEPYDLTGEKESEGLRDERQTEREIRSNKDTHIHKHTHTNTH